MVGPRAKREAVRVVREEAGLSERRACGVIGIPRGSGRNPRKERNEAALRARLRELAAERPRFGYRRLYIFLRREKAADGTLRWLVNHKRVYRLYREEGLAMQRKRRKRFRAEARVPLALPTRANEMWTMDYTHDQMADGRKFRTLNLMDGYTREALRIEPDTSLPGLRVVRILESLRERRGTPAVIQVDNGTEFTSRVVDQWAYQNQVALHFIERGKPTQDAFIESFNGKFRDECLNQNWFVDLRHARELIEAWRVDYNTVRPHSSLGYRTPEEFAAANGCGKDSGFATLENAPRFPLSPMRQRRAYFEPCGGTKNPGSFVMTGPKTGGRSELSSQTLRSGSVSSFWSCSSPNCQRAFSNALFCLSRGRPKLNALTEILTSFLDS